MTLKIKLIIIFIFGYCFLVHIKAQNIDSLINNAQQYKLLSKEIQLLSKSLKIAQKQKDTLKQINIYEKFTQISNLYQKSYFLKKQTILLNSYIKTHPSAFLYKKLYNAYKHLGIIYEKKSELEASEYYYRKLVNIAQLLKNDSLLMESFKLLGALFYFQHEFDSSKYYLNQAIKIANKLNDTREIITLNNLISEIYLYQRDYNKAIQLISNDLNKALILRDTLLISFTYLIIAKLHYQYNILDSAEQYLKKSVSFFQKKFINTKNIYNNQFVKHLFISQSILYGKLLLKRKQYSEALNFFKLALKYTNVENNPFLFIIENAYIGIIYSKIHKSSLALKYITTAKNLSWRYKNITFHSIISYALGVYYYEKGNYQKGQFYLLKAIKNAQKELNYEILIQSYKELSDLYEKNGDYQKSLVYYKKMQNTKDSLYTYKILQNILQKKFDVKLENIENYYKTIIKLKKTYNKYLLISLSIILIFLIYISYLLINSRQKHRLLKLQKDKISRQQQIIEKQNKHFRLLSLVASHTNNSIFILDSSWEFIWVNPAFEKLYNITFDEFKKKYKNFFEATNYENPNLIYQKCFIERKPFIYYNKHIINERNIWIQTTISPIIEENKIVNLIGIESDITRLKLAETHIENQKKELEQKNKLLKIYNQELLLKQKEIIRQNEELRQQQEELKAHTEMLYRLNKELELLSIVASHTDNSVIIFNPDGRIIWANKSFEKNTGYSLEEFKEKFGETIFEMSNFSEIEEYFYKAINERISVKYIAKFTTKYGKTVWFQTTLTPIIDEENHKKIKYIVAIDTDITAIKEAEEKIQQQNKEIVSSIEYANRILKAITPLPIFLNVIYKDYFILNLPKSIVSGDFYYVSHKKNKIITALADCTGHGIPGAFMSIIGNMAFYTVLNSIKTYKADIILSELRKIIIRLLHQRGKTGEPFDSMDVALTIFDTETQILEYAGANIPLYLVRKDQSDNEPEVKRIKPTKTTIGYTENEQPFNLHIIKLTENDYIYMTSDGYTDQIGGENKKRFKRKRFMNLLKEVYGLPMPQQREVFFQTFQRWKGACEQIDDILVLGIKFI